MSPSHAHRYLHLDALRAVAAVLVLAGHARSFAVVDFAQAGSAGALARAIYFATSLGHQAVMVFFALSGFLIGGQVLARILDGAFSWRVYSLRRLTRLWIVVVPALALTFLFDRLGMASPGAAGYEGAWYPLLSSGPDTLPDHSIEALAGNLAFLQTISVPVFGTNGPLWSLANEFWYYFIFPLLAAAALLPRPLLQRLPLAIAGLGLLFWLPGWLVQLGAIWAAGALFGWLTLKPWCRDWARSWAARMLAAIVACAALAIGRFSSFAYADQILGIAIAACLPVLAMLPAPDRGVYAALSRGGAAISYTLYLTHFPLLAAIWFGLIAPQQWPMGGTGILVVAGLCSAAILWAAAVWWCFERHTDRLFRWLVRQTGRPMAARPAEPG